MSTPDIWTETYQLRQRYNRRWFMDHLTRTVLRRENIWTKKRLDLHEKLMQSAESCNASLTTIDEHSDIVPEDFHRNYLETDTPVIFRGVGKDWAAGKWTAEGLGERFPDTTCRLIRAAPNEPKGVPGEGMDASYADIAKSMREGGDLYARFSGIMNQHPELIDDIDIEWFRTMRRDVNDFENWGFFMGGAGTATGLHCSIAPNLFYQISGKKRWWIYPSKADPFFAPAVKCSPYFYSEVDVSDEAKWPIAENLPGWIADLEPGDVLFVPAFAWHQVYNNTSSIASGYRWMDVKLGWRNSKMKTFLAATCSNPSLWKAKGHRDLPTLLDAIDY